MNTTPKDFFLHVAATVSLYAAAIALINLAFSIVNYAIPDALASGFYGNPLAWPISMLIVLVPLLYILEFLIGRDIRKMPEKATIWVRRWRIYLTLFLAGATIVGDLIALINTYLNGELTGRFGYKILAILIICGVIFAYYLLQRLTGIDAGSAKKVWTKVLAWLGIVVTVAAIIGGFLIVGSPATQRAIRFDQQRVNDLSNIQWQIISTWQRTGKLPATLDELKDSISGTVVPTDPETKQAYIYARTSLTKFDICASFSRESKDLSGRGAYNSGGGISYPTVAYDMAMPYPGGDKTDLWNHGTGRTCFSRTIDPERYPVNKPIPLQAI